MSKILYAINQKDAEENITKALPNNVIPVGAVQYKEAIVSMLATTEADILLIRESLPGITEFLSLLKTVRFQQPTVRIICLLNEREDRTDPILASLVSLGIYDIVNQNSIKVSEIVSYITTPRTFRDVAEYYGGATPDVMDNSAEEKQESDEKKSGGFFSSFFGLGKNNHKSDVQISTDTRNSVAQPDIDTLRAAIQEEADRKARAKMDQIVQEMVDKQTTELRENLDAANSKISEALAEKKAADEHSFKVIADFELLRKELESKKKELSDLQTQSKATIETYEQQLQAVKSVNSPDVFSDKMHEWEESEQKYRNEIESLKTKLSEATQEKESLQTELDAEKEEKKISPKFDFDTVDSAAFVMPEDPADYIPVANSSAHTYLFVGAKHGVGNTTVALNVATAMAEKGYKTLFIEFNSHYPMINEYFEFISIQRGIDTAIAGLNLGNTVSVDAAIIKPHGIQTQKKQLSKVYTKLPGALHFMLFTNQYLQMERNGGAPGFSNKNLTALLKYLTNQLGYVYVVIDAQPDDMIGQTLFRQCGEDIDQMVFTCSQDTHSITTAGLMINDLARSQSSAHVKGIKMIVNYFNNANDLSIGKIAKWLNMSPRRFFTVSDDRMGYYKASFSMLPYLLSGGKFSKEFYDMISKL